MTGKDSSPASPWSEGEVLANISHELRTPLHGIMGMAESLAKSPLSPDQRTSVRLLQASAGSLLEVVEDLLDYSLLEAGQFRLVSEEFDLEQLLAELFGSLEAPARQRGLRLRYEAQPDVPVLLKGDARRLRQVLHNLVSNAIKFTPAGEVSTTVMVSGHYPGRLTLHFQVHDSGIGIPQDQHSAVFEPFVKLDGSTTRTTGGAGLGLRIAAQLVKLMEGEIWLESAAGEGSRFHFTASFATVPRAVAAPPADCPDAPRPGTILLAEDNYINQVVTTRVLEKHGHRVLVGANGRLALEILQREPIDLVLMDIQMPEMDGFQATRAIREQEEATGAHLPIIALTAHEVQGYRQKCLEAGMDEYLSKPVCSRDLLVMVERTLGVARRAARSGSRR